MAFRAPAADEGQLDVNQTLFTVLAAINAAGYDADLESPANHPLRKAVREYIASKNPPVLTDLKAFFAAHKKANSTAELSQYISFGLSVGDPPDFKFKYRTLDLPPDVVPLAELPELLSRFYREAEIDQIWPKCQPAFEEALARYHEPVLQAVLQVNAYLRNETSGSAGRGFQIYLELLAPPNQIQSRRYANQSYIVLTPSAEAHVNDVRRAYLFYLLEPMVVRQASLLEKGKSLWDYAQGAPGLAEHYKNDFILLATASMVRAVESRLDRQQGAELADAALKEGFVLVPFFVEQLARFEKQEQVMRLYFPDLMKALDVNREAKRLEGVPFSAPKERMAKVVEQPQPAPVPSGPMKTIEEAERLYSERKLDEARDSFNRALGESDDKPLHARAYYGLARIAILQRDAELGLRLFEKARESSPEPYVKAWVLVYLGRLADASADREKAIGYYKEALTVEGASMAARKAAEKEIQQGLAK